MITLSNIPVWVKKGNPAKCFNYKNPHVACRSTSSRFRKEFAKMPKITAQSFNHVAIWVKDVRKSADWYIQKLGLREVSASEHRIFLKLADGGVLALFETLDTDRIGKGVHHLAFNLTSQQEESALEILRQQNIPLQQRGPNLSFQDPDGHWIHFS
jgi:catechol 2,3-dioxygenase-like lactoylglutathione lyase family enzyme